jgi:predicted CopG family antitoxin
MPNQFSEIFNNQQVSTAIPLPFNTIIQAGAIKQQSYDNALSTAQDVEDNLKVNAIDEHQPKKQQLLQNYRSKVEDLANDIVKTGNTSRINDIKRIANQWNNDPLRNELETSYLEKAADIKDVQESNQKGVYTDVYNPFRDYKGIDDNGNIIPYRRRGVKPSQNYLSVGQKLMDGIKESANNNPSYRINSDGSVTGIEDGWKAIYEDDVKRVAKKSLEPFLSSKEGEYYIDEQKYYGNKDITASALSYLEQLGNKQIHTETTSGSKYEGFLPEDVRNPKPVRAVPIYDSPLTAIKGTDYGKAFDIKDKGSIIPYTPEEAKKIIGNITSSNGSAYDILKNKIAAGKQKTEAGYSQPRELSETEKGFMTSIAKTVNQDIYDKIKDNKDLTPEEQKSFYPIVRQMADRAKQDIEVNSRVIGLVEEEAKQINTSLFGSNDAIAKNLGSGNMFNLKFFDKENNKVLKNYEELKSQLNDEDKVLIKGKYTGENPYQTVTGDKSFKNPYQLFIGGKEYVVSGPKAYVTEGSQDINNPEQENLTRTNTISDIYQVRFSPVPVELDVHGEKIKIFFEPSKENPTEGVYQLDYKNKMIKSSSASKIENYIYGKRK